MRLLKIGPLEKRLTHMPFTHAFTGSNPVRVTITNVLIAQLDRAFDYGSKGWGFKSSWVRHREVA